MKNLKKFDLNNIDKSKWESFSFEKIAFRIAETVDPNTTELEIYYGLEHLDAESLHIRRNGVPSDVSGGKLNCYPGDIIFGKRRAYQRKAGIVKEAGICSAHSFVFRANEEIIDARLFPFFLHSDQFMHKMIDISVGGLSPTINWSDLKHQEFLLPSKDQQAELADLLWAMDEVIEKDLIVLEKLDSSIKSITLFAIDNFERKTMGEIANEIIGGFAFKSETFKNKNSSYIPIIKITNVKQNGVEILEKANYIDKKDLNENIIKKYSVIEGDLVLALTGATLGKSTLIKEKEKNFLINQRVAKIQFSKKTNFFYKIILDSDYFKIELKKYISEGAQGNISVSDLSKILLPVIKNDFILLNKIIDLNNSKFNLNSKIQSSRTLQKSLINQIF